LFARAQEDDEEPIPVVPPQEAEKYPFEAEVHKMLDIVVNSLYQHNEVFLRELISNASDALDKLRYLALTDPEKFRSDGNDLEVQIEFDPEQQTLTIRDTGVGMTHDEMVENLGTVARSGTTKFIEALKDSGNSGQSMDQIGQFGVGFYSAFLVAKRVVVASKNPNDPVQYVWESRNGSGDFLVYPDPRGNTLERGTEVTLHLKDDSLEYADQDRIRDLAKHYSEFVVYPISLRTTTTTTVEVDEEEKEEVEKPAEEEEKKDEDDIEVGDDGDVEEEPPQVYIPKKTKKVHTESWEILNGNKAIWTREKEDISDEDYEAFWHALVGDDTSKVASHSHFVAEGNINFKSILYLPDQPPEQYRLGSIDNVAGGTKLYVRRVLISDSFELLPKYLGFIRGVVDSDDLPLNVNRETLQESKILTVIKKKVTRKAIDMIKAFAQHADEKTEDVEYDEIGNVVEKDEDAPSAYIEWYKKFSANIKLGVIDDEPNRAKLSKLLRFVTSKSNGKFISLDQIVDNMKDWQDEIFVLGGTSVAEVEQSPFLEVAKDKDVEVIYLTDAVDEYMVKQVVDYKNKKFVHLSSEGVKFKDESNDVILRREKLYKKKFSPMISWLRKLYTGTVLRVQVAKRPLGSIPAIVSSSDFGNSANMERILRAQAFQHGVDETGYMAMKVFEFNPRHPLILKIFEGCPPEGDAGKDFEVSRDTIDAAWMIHDMAMLNGGFPVSDPNAHNRRMMKMLKNKYGMESLALEPEIDAPEEEDEPPQEVVINPNEGLNAEDYKKFADLGIDVQEVGKEGEPEKVKLEEVVINLEGEPEDEI
jgi:heat shock protein beta